MISSQVSTIILASTQIMEVIRDQCPQISVDCLNLLNVRYTDISYKLILPSKRKCGHSTSSNDKNRNKMKIFYQLQ